MKTNLRPCPFCGRNDRLIFEPLPGCTDVGNVACVCGASYTTITQGVDDWNTRPIEDGLQAKVVALQKELDELKNGDKQYKRKVGKPDVGEDLILFMQYDDIDTEYALGYMEEDGKFYFSQDEEGKFEDEYWAVIAWAYVAASKFTFLEDRLTDKPEQGE